MLQLNLFIFLNISNLFVQFFLLSSSDHQKSRDKNWNQTSHFSLHLGSITVCSYQQLAAFNSWQLSVFVSCSLTSQQPFIMHLGWFGSTKEQLQFQKVIKLGQKRGKIHMAGWSILMIFSRTRILKLLYVPPTLLIPWCGWEDWEAGWVDWESHQLPPHSGFPKPSSSPSSSPHSTPSSFPYHEC